MAVPFSVVGEMLFGASNRGWGSPRRYRLERFLQEYMIAYPNYAVCELWAEIRVVVRSAGYTIERQDAWLAATALYLDVPLVTHNARHYLGVPGLQVITEPDP